MVPVVKAHAYGNDFLYVEDTQIDGRDRVAVARTMCARHTGIGADGLILYRRTQRGASMQLLNADGSYSEVSGNGVRGLAAVLLDVHGFLLADDAVIIDTDAGEKRLKLLRRDGAHWVFRAAMGRPTTPVETTLDVLGAPLRVVTLRVGNPQCVRLETSLSEERMHRLGGALEHHEAFPEGTNVEFAHVENPDQVRILIWERGVGPTMASGTGACAAAVASAAFGGANRDVQVVSPGGTQRVEWLEDGLYLTGWAEVVMRGEWAL
ncbi:MAG TPA: diaminopimelate epimerase [Vicinamibacterales bacterium]|jgi:diaminopimelate epimerase